MIYGSVDVWIDPKNGADLPRYLGQKIEREREREIYMYSSTTIKYLNNIDEQISLQILSDT
jgi:hypothetical protein